MLDVRPLTPVVERASTTQRELEVIVTIRAYLQVLISVAAFGCSQGPTWAPPDDGELLVDAGTSANIDNPLSENESSGESDLWVDVVVPRDGQGCSRVGEFVHLEATLGATDAVSVKWSFEREQAGCEPVTLGEIDSATTHTDAYSMFIWSTACANDIPNGCGMGPGRIIVQVTSADGVTEQDQVPFCLDPARRPVATSAAVAD